MSNTQHDDSQFDSVDLMIGQLADWFKAPAAPVAPESEIDEFLDRIMRSDRTDAEESVLPPVDEETEELTASESPRSARENRRESAHDLVWPDRRSGKFHVVELKSWSDSDIPAARRKKREHWFAADAGRRRDLAAVVNMIDRASVPRLRADALFGGDWESWLPLMVRQEVGDIVRLHFFGPAAAEYPCLAPLRRSAVDMAEYLLVVCRGQSLAWADREVKRRPAGAAPARTSAPALPRLVAAVVLDDWGPRPQTAPEESAAYLVPLPEDLRAGDVGGVNRFWHSTLREQLLNEIGNRGRQPW